jgi:hypothetical protein
MEADFNAMNKEVYGVRMLEEARKYKHVLEEIFSEQNHTADDGGLEKTLFYDIACQLRIPATIAYRSMPPTAMTILHMPWLCSFFNPLASRTRQ